MPTERYGSQVAIDINIAVGTMLLPLTIKALVGHFVWNTLFSQVP